MERKQRPSYRQRGKTPSNGKIQRLLYKINSELGDSIEPISLTRLNAFERKLVHRHFDHNPNVVTKTYRHDDVYELMVFPVGNLRKYALAKANEAIATGDKVVLPKMSNYERFVVHEALKDLAEVKSNSYGEGEDRHIELVPEVFGRGLKRIIKKIKLF
jgi:predicted RNA-binding protein Jag